jgi:hypothetical protein
MAEIVDVKAGVKNILDRIAVACEKRPKQVALEMFEKIS